MTVVEIINNLELPWYTCSFQVDVMFWPQLYILVDCIVPGHLELTIANKARDKCEPVDTELLETESHLWIFYFFFIVWAFHLQIKKTIIDTSSYVSFFNFKFWWQTTERRKTKIILKYGLHCACWHIWVRAYFTCSNSSRSCSENMFVWPVYNCRTSLTSWWP